MYPPEFLRPQYASYLGTHSILSSALSELHVPTRTALQLSESLDTS